MGIYVPIPDENDEIKGNLQPRSNFERKPPWKGRIQWAIEQRPSMSQACMLVGCDYKTFRKWAKLYGLWCPNQAGKGISKKRTPKPQYYHDTMVENYSWVLVDFDDETEYHEGNEEYWRVG